MENPNNHLLFYFLKPRAAFSQITKLVGRWGFASCSSRAQHAYTGSISTAIQICIILHLAEPGCDGALGSGPNLNLNHSCEHGVRHKQI